MLHDVDRTGHWASRVLISCHRIYILARNNEHESLVLVPAVASRFGDTKQDHLDLAIARKRKGPSKGSSCASWLRKYSQLADSMYNGKNMISIPWVRVTITNNAIHPNHVHMVIPLLPTRLRRKCQTRGALVHDPYSRWTRSTTPLFVPSGNKLSMQILAFPVSTDEGTLYMTLERTRRDSRSLQSRRSSSDHSAWAVAPIVCLKLAGSTRVRIRS